MLPTKDNLCLPTWICNTNRDYINQRKINDFPSRSLSRTKNRKNQSKRPESNQHRSAAKSNKHTYCIINTNNSSSTHTSNHPENIHSNQKIGIRRRRSENWRLKEDKNQQITYHAILSSTRCMPNSLLQYM